MAYYNVCPDCGSNLDPGEKCDCEREIKKRDDYISRHTEVNKRTGQISFKWNYKEA